MGLGSSKLHLQVPLFFQEQVEEQQQINSFIDDLMVRKIAQVDPLLCEVIQIYTSHFL